MPIWNCAWLLYSQFLALFIIWEANFIIWEANFAIDLISCKEVHVDST